MSNEGINVSFFSWVMMLHGHALSFVSVYSIVWDLLIKKAHIQLITFQDSQYPVCCNLFVSVQRWYHLETVIAILTKGFSISWMFRSSVGCGCRRRENRVQRRHSTNHSSSKILHTSLFLSYTNQGSKFHLHSLRAVAILSSYFVQIIPICLILFHIAY